MLLCFDFIEQKSLLLNAALDGCFSKIIEIDKKYKKGFPTFPRVSREWLVKFFLVALLPDPSFFPLQLFWVGNAPESFASLYFSIVFFIIFITVVGRFDGIDHFTS